MRTKSRRGLELEQLVIIVAIIGITAMIAVPQLISRAPRSVAVAGVKATFDRSAGRAKVINTSKGVATVTIARRMDDDDEAWRDVASFFLDPGETWEGAAPGRQWEVRVSSERTPLAVGVTDE